VLELVVHARHLVLAHVPTHPWFGCLPRLLIGLLLRRRRWRPVLIILGKGSDAEAKQGCQKSSSDQRLACGSHAKGVGD
jgi:hypothetical protein